LQAGQGCLCQGGRGGGEEEEEESHGGSLAERGPWGYGEGGSILQQLESPSSDHSEPGGLDNSNWLALQEYRLG
jgi:hypothetical protein